MSSLLVCMFVIFSVCMYFCLFVCLFSFTERVKTVFHSTKYLRLWRVVWRISFFGSRMLLSNVYLQWLKQGSKNIMSGRIVRNTIPQSSLIAYATSLGCQRQPSLLCHAWNHDKPHENSSPSTHYNDAIMGAIASQITSLTIVYSTVYSGTHQRKHQSSASLAFVWGIHRGPVNSPHKGPVTRKMFRFDGVTMWKPSQLAENTTALIGIIKINS